MPLFAIHFVVPTLMTWLFFYWHRNTLLCRSAGYLWFTTAAVTRGCYLSHSCVLIWFLQVPFEFYEVRSNHTRGVNCFMGVSKTRWDSCYQSEPHPGCEFYPKLWFFYGLLRCFFIWRFAVWQIASHWRFHTRPVNSFAAVKLSALWVCLFSRQGFQTALQLGCGFFIFDEI